MIILGIETSCDETSVAIIDAKTNQKQKHNLSVLAENTATSINIHSKTGGIIPENAAREQLVYMIPTLQKTLFDAFGETFEGKKNSIPPVDVIAVTNGPGLIGSLLVGVETAKTLSFLWKKPLIPVNHLYGHIYANFIGKSLKDIEFPAIALVVSGGHTDLIYMKNVKSFRVIGSTKDDAAGEAFDKIGRLFGLSYPAGATIARFALKGDPKSFVLPRPMIYSGDFDFSFSGLKTAVYNLLKKNNWDFSDSSFFSKNKALLSDLCASTQEAIIDVLVKKTISVAKKKEVRSILLGGGVSANKLLRKEFEQKISEELGGVHFFVPDPKYSTDNGAMIAAAGFFQNKDVSWRDVSADPTLYY